MPKSSKWDDLILDATKEMTEVFKEEITLFLKDNTTKVIDCIVQFNESRFSKRNYSTVIDYSLILNIPNNIDINKKDIISIEYKNNKYIIHEKIYKNEGFNKLYLKKV
ncbi:hypothetical protein [Silvanigrella sp.]|uniref:hypothetical protein n=1 Tax=Silvanigrella sp. TaxID=2024976 RepID=UPI0037CCB345